MDQKLLESLNNLSFALQEISDALKSKSEAQSATAKALQGGDFIKEIKEINVGVKQLQKDTKEILKNQQTIMSMAKSKSDKKENVAENLGKDKTSQKNFKEGIGVILLIAVAVLAIGAAFNLVGKVNFLAVIALSIALPLLAIAFAKVHTTLKTVGFDPKKDAVNFIIAVTSIALGLTMASWILSMISPLTFAKFFTTTFIALTFAMLGPSIYKFMMAFKDMSWSQLIKSVVAFPLILPAIALGIAFASWAFQLIKPIGFSQFLTAVGIGVVFAIVSFGIRKMLKSFDGLNIADLAKAVIFLPLILPAIALGLALSSYAFQLIRPISFIQFLTAVGIAAVFAVVSFGIRKMLKSFQGMDPATLIAASIMLPVLLVGISYAIALSSKQLAKVVPVSFIQFLTSLGIAAVFTVLSFGLKGIVKAVGEMKWGDVPKIPVFLTLVSIAIMLSSHILALTKTINNATLLNILKFGITLGIITIAMGATFMLLNKMKVGVKDALIGGLLTVIISTAIMISSHILALGDYSKYPDWKWALGVGLSLVAFTPAIVLLGAIAMSGVGALAILAGAGMILLVAATITGASHILAAGKYGNYPPVSWSASIAISMMAFTAGMVTLGALIFATFGLGAGMLAAGSEAVLMVADTIVKASFILDKGKYTGGPTLEWAGGIALALGAFSPVYAMLVANKLMSLFGGGVGPEDFSEAIITVSEGIVSAAGFFANNKSAFKNGPSKEWAEGVGTAIGAFAPVYKVLADNSGWMKSGVSVEDMAKAIMTISQGIVDAAKFFAENTSPFQEGNYPSKNWGEGVGAALGAFAPVFKSLSEDTGWFTSGDDVINNMVNAVGSISRALVNSAKIFGEAGPDAWKTYPDKTWAEGVKTSIDSFIGLYKNLSESDTDPSDLNLISQYARQMANTASILGKNKKYFDTQIDPNFVKKMSKNILDYQNLVKSMSGFKSGGIGSMFGLDPVQRVASGMVKIADAYDRLAKAVKGFSSALNSLDPMRVYSFTRLTGNIAMLSAMDSNMFSNMLKVLESRAGVFAKLIDIQEKKAMATMPKVKTATGGASQTGKKGEDYSGMRDAKGETQLQKLDKIVAILTLMNENVVTIDQFLQTSGGKNSDIGKGDG